MEIFEQIPALKEKGTPAVLATVVEVSGSGPGRPCAKMLVKGDGSILGTIGGGAIEKKIIEEALLLMHSGEPKLVHYNLEDIGMACGGAMSVFLEPLKHAPDLIVFGAGHIGSALSRIGKMLDFTVTVIDNRAEFANKEKLAWADKVIAAEYKIALENIVFSDNTFVVILTHRHVHDYEILEHCVMQSFKYLGMIGSRNKVSKCFQQLREKGIDDEILNRIHAPIGIRIGGNTPSEIAVSIAAELVAVRSGT